MKEHEKPTSAKETERSRRGRKRFEFRSLPSIKFTPHAVPEKFRQLCEDVILPEIPFTGYKIQDQKETAMQCLHSLINANFDRAAVADSRDTSQSDTRARAKIWDFLFEYRYCELCLGSEQSGKVTRYRATEKLMELREVWDSEFLEGRPEEELPDPGLLGLVRIKVEGESGKTFTVSVLDEIKNRAQRGVDGNPDPQAVENGIEFIRNIENELDAINSVNADHAWKAKGMALHGTAPLNTQLYFQFVDRLWNRGRLYTLGRRTAQGVPRTLRHTMRIDKEPVAVVDFSGSWPTLAYHSHGIEVSGDVYQPKQIMPETWQRSKDKKLIRKLIKQATLFCLNTDRVRAKGAIAEYINAETHKAHFFWDCLKNEFGNEPLNGLVERISQVHQPIARFLFDEVESAELVSKETSIVREVLRRFVIGKQKPALPMHDALIVKAGDADSVREDMVAGWQWLLSTELTPEITKKDYSADAE